MFQPQKPFLVDAIYLHYTFPNDCVGPMGEMLDGGICLTLSDQRGRGWKVAVLISTFENFLAI